MPAAKQERGAWYSILRKRSSSLVLWGLLGLLLLGAQEAVSQGDPIDSLSELLRDALRQRLEAVSAGPLTIQGTSLHATDGVLRFYAQRAYQPAWSNDAGLLLPVDVLLTTLRAADQEGLRTVDYHLTRLNKLLAEIRQIHPSVYMFHMDKLITLDLLLTDAFLTYGIHALNGRVHPEAIRAQWFTERQQADPVVVLRHGLETQRVDEALRTLLPQEGGYYRLRQALTHYRLLASRGGWPQIAAGPIIQLGDHDPRVKTLRHRLRITGDLPVPASTESKESDGFDEALAKAVRRFQQRHGMEADGIVGPLTLAALNVPVEARVRQIAVNMERWRWLPHHLGQRYILVNIARFTLEVIEDGKSTLNMRIIVGKPYQSTPVFNATMTHLVVNPSWYVPASIAKEELLPVFRRDPDYLIRHNMRVSLSGVGEINPRSINWLQVSAANFPYRLRQVPGPKNPLGRVKFLFPNQFSVYLHDTSNPELFARPVRTFSHGCIRIEKPLDLAEYVLRGDSSWDRHKLQRAMVHGGERTIFLPTAIPVYLLYWTAWVEEDGVVHFRDDIYQRDTPLEKALFASLMTF